MKFPANRHQTQAGIWETFIDSGCGQCKEWTQTCLRTARERGMCAATDKLRSWLRTGCGHGLITDADADWTWSIHGYGLDMDWTKIRIVRGRGLDTVTDKSRSRSGHGLDTGKYADRSRTWIVCGHGQTVVVVADWMRARTDYGRGCGLDNTTASWPDNDADISRLIRDSFADNRTLKIQGVRRPLLNSHKSCEPSRINMPAGYGTDFGTLRHLAETFLTIQTH